MCTLRPAVALIATGLLLGSTVACERTTIYRDHEVFFDGVREEEWKYQDPIIVPGVYEEQLFRELTESDDAQIINGFQGGIWMHISVRVGGAPPDGRLTALLEPDVGGTELVLRLTDGPDGFFEVYDVPIPIFVRGTTLDALEGTAGTLILTWLSEASSLEASLPVTFRTP